VKLPAPAVWGLCVFVCEPLEPVAVKDSDAIHLL
jgi:hypothetical protein